MRLTRHFPRGYESLRALVHQAADDSQSVVMQAGHFLLYYDSVDGRILPCLAESLVEARHAEIKNNYAQFPILTWRLGLRLLASLPARDKRIMVVVNDWQYLSKKGSRADFYANHRYLPESYVAELARYSDPVTLLEPKKIKMGTSTAPFYGEMNLRNRYQRHTAGIAQKPPSCSLPDAAGVQKEVYCSYQAGDCAGEIAEMIYEASSRAAATCFINLYPLVCREFVEKGSQLAVDLLGSTCTSILNIGFQSTAVLDCNQLIETAEATLHR